MGLLVYILALRTACVNVSRLTFPLTRLLRIVRTYNDSVRQTLLFSYHACGYFDIMSLGFPN